MPLVQFIFVCWQRDVRKHLMKITRIRDPNSCQTCSRKTTINVKAFFSFSIIILLLLIINSFQHSGEVVSTISLQQVGLPAGRGFSVWCLETLRHNLTCTSLKHNYIQIGPFSTVDSSCAFSSYFFAWVFESITKWIIVSIKWVIIIALL